MNNLYDSYTDDELWVVKESEWQPELQNIREAQFALGNGYFGSRASLEEMTKGCVPGFYLAGIYDKLTAQVSEIVNFPNPFNFKFSVGGEKIGNSTMDVISHKRTLNMKKGLLLRSTLFKGSKGPRFDYQSLRFISMDNKNVGVMRIEITPLDKDCTIDIQTGIDTSVYNIGTVTEGKKKHFRLKELGQHKNAGYLAVDTFEKKHSLIYWAGFYYEYAGKKTYAKDNVFKIKVKKKKTIVFTKVFYVKHFPSGKSHSRYKTQTFKKFNEVFHTKFSVLMNNHVQEWKNVWEKADIIIKGTANLQVIMRFNLYHMQICAHYDDGASSIGARTLSGEGYRGHIFWDAEIFLFPYYLYTYPEVAKNMLLYRYKRLDQAREIAKSLGYKGAMFPWESADSGCEETPTWAKDINGQIVKIFTNKMEHHITPDIAHAVSSYYLSTGDRKFMEEYGFEMILETARFCESRLEHNKKTGFYEINNVIGPDEFHVGVNNNVYTNMMFKWNMLEGCRIYYNLKKKSPGLCRSLSKKINLKEPEVRKWKNNAEKIKPFKMNRNKVIEQFDGYFKLKNVNFTETDENGVPVIPENIGTMDMSKTQFIKQCDVLMLLFVLSSSFKSEYVKANYDYYLMKTAHKSSLSASTTAAVACWAGDLYRAYHLFNVSLRADISNLYGNTNEGAHAASLGGTYQALILGFAGVRCSQEGLFVNPRMPRTWEKLIFNFCWKDCLIEFEISNSMVQFKIKSKRKKELMISVFDVPHMVTTNKAYAFTQELEKPRIEFYY